MKMLYSMAGLTFAFAAVSSLNKLHLCYMHTVTCSLHHWKRPCQPCLVFEQAQVLQDRLARVQHACMLQHKLKVQVVHLLCQTGTVTSLGAFHASFALQHGVSIKSLR